MPEIGGEHYHEQSEWSLIDLGLKRWKLWPIIFLIPHYFDTILSLWRFRKNVCSELVTPQFISTTGLGMCLRRPPSYSKCQTLYVLGRLRLHFSLVLSHGLFWFQSSFMLHVWWLYCFLKSISTQILYFFLFVYVYSACDADTRFHCGSGECKPLCKRCDGHRDCADSSDEFNCSTYTFFSIMSNILRIGFLYFILWICDSYSRL